MSTKQTKHPQEVLHDWRFITLAVSKSCTRKSLLFVWRYGVYIRGARLPDATRHKTFSLSAATMIKTAIILILLQTVTAANLREFIKIIFKPSQFLVVPRLGKLIAVFK
jgi:hypothetical protein